MEREKSREIGRDTEREGERERERVYLTVSKFMRESTAFADASFSALPGLRVIIEASGAGYSILYWSLDSAKRLKSHQTSRERGEEGGRWKAHWFMLIR